MPQIQANFSQSRNDMYWSIYDLGEGRITWTGYDDGYWWGNVAKNEKWRTRVGAKTGRTYTLDPLTNMVSVTDAN